MNEVKYLEERDALRLQILRLQIANFNLQHAQTVRQIADAEQRLVQSKVALGSEFQGKYGVLLDDIEQRGDTWVYQVKGSEQE